MCTKQHMWMSLHMRAWSVAPVQEGLWAEKEGLSCVAPTMLCPQGWAARGQEEWGGASSHVGLEQLWLRVPPRVPLAPAKCQTTSQKPVKLVVD